MVSDCVKPNTKPHLSHGWCSVRRVVSTGCTGKKKKKVGVCGGVWGCGWVGKGVCGGVDIHSLCCALPPRSPFALSLLDLSSPFFSFFTLPSLSLRALPAFALSSLSLCALLPLIIIPFLHSLPTCSPYSISLRALPVPRALPSRSLSTLSLHALPSRSPSRSLFTLFLHDLPARSPCSPFEILLCELPS